MICEDMMLDGMKMKTHTKIKSVIKKGERDFEVVFETKNGEETETFETILVAIGRDANT